MKLPKQSASIVALLAFCLSLTAPMVASAGEVDESIAACLNAWGDHPFGKNPKFKTLDASVKMFGIGKGAADTEPTSAPSLVLINPIVNVMGGSSVALMNPNGWYCLRTTVSIVGPVSIRTHCKARLAAASDGKVALADNTENRAIKNLNVTVIGSVSIERPCS